MRRWLLGIAAVGIGLPLVLVLVGLALPSAHVASIEVRLPAPPAVAWERIAHPETSAAWRPSVESVERLADRDGRPLFRESTSFGPILYVHESVEPKRRLVTRIVDNEDFGGTWEYRLDPEGTGTRLSITERGEVHDPLFRVLGRFVFGHDATLRTYANDLAAVLGPAGN